MATVKTVITLTILHDESFELEGMSLEDIGRDMDSGELQGTVEAISAHAEDDDEDARTDRLRATFPDEYGDADD